MENPLEGLKKFFDRLAGVPILEWAYALPQFRITKLKKGEFFFKLGEPATRLGVLMNGLGMTYYTLSDGKKKIRRFLVAQDPCASYPAITEQGLATDTFEALEDCIIAWIEYSAYEKLLERHICWERITRKSLEDEIKKREKKEYELFTLSAAERLNIFTKE
ncbi:MAG: Crp/Fnr family transcriptional regulator, partial [Bdellovibrionaceae bacterium]|nr:Crp/Fnr family transcriptional regulator [Pseudobdellovibrionaceae bacterium]